MTRRRTVELLLAGLALLAVAWSLTPRSAPPLYDGVGFPDEPYRFVVLPDGATATKAATIAVGAADVSGATVGAVHAASSEQAPQVSVVVPIGRLHAPAGTRRVTLRAAPVQPVDPPDKAFLWSNVYDVEATTASVTLTDAAPPATITLRAATAQRPSPTIEHYTGRSWTKIRTIAVGTDIYEATLPSLGRYAVIGPRKLDVSQLKLGGAKKQTTYTGIIVAVLAVAIVIGLFVIGQRRRSKTRRARRNDAAGFAQHDPAQHDPAQHDASQPDASQPDASQPDDAT